MKALRFKAVNQPIAYEDVPAPEPQAGEIIVDIKAAALNHRDNWILKGQYPGLREDTILGSDGAGIYNGQPVIINPNKNWGDSEKHQGPNFHILGMPGDGTLAEQIAVGEDRLVEMPAHLTFEQAAALPLAGLTAWRALMTRCALQAGEKVLISGVGGGVALFACQFAIAAGAEVYVTSSSPEKIARAVEMGAVGGANYTEDNWFKPFGKETGGFDVIIDSAAGDGFKNLVRLTKPGARIAFYGGTRGNINGLNPAQIFFRQLTIMGSTMGSDKEFGDMVTFVNEHQIVPVVDSVFKLSEGADAIARMNAGMQFGKIVLTPD